MEGIASLKEGSKVELDSHTLWVRDSPVLGDDDVSTHCGTQTRTSYETTESSLTGDLSKLDLASVLKALDASAQSGVLELVLADGRGAKVALRVGRPVAARFAAAKGEAAFLQLLAAAQAGTFSFTTKPHQGPPEIRRSLRSLLDEATCASGKAMVS
ncbi:MAG: DUF4388 domain-containing protein [Planctomycetota bacterium]